MNTEMLPSEHSLIESEVTCFYEWQGIDITDSPSQQWGRSSLPSRKIEFTLPRMASTSDFYLKSPPPPRS
jgi:hypothetical protein